MTVSLSALQIGALVLDIEGTTTPVAFVYEVLFPFARSHVAAYLAREGELAACRAAVERLREERATDIAQGLYPSEVAQDFSPAVTAQDFSPAVVAQEFGPAEVVAYVHWLMDRDRKSPGLKALQGLIWQEGFRSGELRGQVYPDVAPAFERWRARGLDIHIYSSGSVLAQQLLLGSTNAGNLTAFLRGHFDTEVGPKTSPDSYRLIAERIEVPPSHTLFVSDVVAELDAASAAGLRTALCVRGDVPPDAKGYPVVRSFADLAD